MPITSDYSPKVFTLVRMSALCKSHFDDHPIWSEHYDFDEREEIVSWGVDPQWLASELKLMHDGDDHCVYPVLRPHPLPDRMRLYIKARLSTAEGLLLDGYVVNEDALVLTIFIGDGEHVFSRQPTFADLNYAELRNLRAALAMPSANVFPVRYETDILDSGNRLISGEFHLPTRAK